MNHIVPPQRTPRREQPRVSSKTGKAVFIVSGLILIACAAFLYFEIYSAYSWIWYAGIAFSALLALVSIEGSSDLNDLDPPVLWSKSEERQNGDKEN